MSKDGRIGESARDDEEKQSVPRDLDRHMETTPQIRRDPLNFVDFDSSQDELNPQNWSRMRKTTISIVCQYCCLCVNFASTAWSPATKNVAKAFGVSSEVASLTLSLFVLGYSFGPIIWGPASELYGRRWPIVVSLFGYACFCAGAATGKDIQTILICRFFCGVMGSCSLTVIAGVFTDIYNHEGRSVAMAVYGSCISLGPTMSPFISGYTVMNSRLGWRFEGYWCLIMAGVALVLTALLVPETYTPVILARKASRLRRQTGDWTIRAKFEVSDNSPQQLLRKYFTRPLRMLMVEPMLFTVSFYMSFVYGILYLFFTAYPLVYKDVHHFNPGKAGLPFFAVMIGCIGSSCWSIALVPVHSRKMAKNNNKWNPEWRMPQVMIGGVCWTASLFWFGWTGFTDRIHWIVPTLSGVLSGFGFLSVFLPLLNCIVDTYTTYAASALSANTMMRSVFGASFPVFAVYMYNGLGIGLATTVLACVSAALVPVPVVFYIYGPRLRQKSEFSSL